MPGGDNAQAAAASVQLTQQEYNAMLGLLVNHDKSIRSLHASTEVTYKIPKQGAKGKMYETVTNMFQQWRDATEHGRPHPWGPPRHCIGGAFVYALLEAWNDERQRPEAEQDAKISDVDLATLHALKECMDATDSYDPMEILVGYAQWLPDKKDRDGNEFGVLSVRALDNKLLQKGVPEWYQEDPSVAANVVWLRWAVIMDMYRETNEKPPGPHVRVLQNALKGKGRGRGNAAAKGKGAAKGKAAAKAKAGGKGAQ